MDDEFDGGLMCCGLPLSDELGKYGCPNCGGDNYERSNRMTASEEAKAAGLKSLSEVSEMTKTSLQTLINWYNNKPELFAVVVAGCAALKGAK